MMAVVKYSVTYVNTDDRTMAPTVVGPTRMYAMLPVIEPRLKHFIRRQSETQGMVITNVEIISVEEK